MPRAALFVAGLATLDKVAVGFDKICAFILFAAALSVIMKSFGRGGIPIFAAVCSVAAVSFFSERLSEIFGLFSRFSDTSDVSSYINACLKVIGVGYLAGISSDICREIGESGAAKCIAVAARLEVVLISVPFMEELFYALLELRGG